MKFFERWILPVVCCVLYAAFGYFCGFGHGYTAGKAACGHECKASTGRAAGGPCGCVDACECDPCECGSKFRPCCNSCTCVASREAREQGVSRKEGGK